MKCFLFVFLLASVVSAGDFSGNRVRYWLLTKGITEGTKNVLVDEDAGVVSGWDAAWGSKPTKSNLVAITEAQAVTGLKQYEASDPNSSVNAFLRFRVLVKARTGVELNSTSDLAGKADDMLIGANVALKKLSDAMDSATTLAEYKAANKAMSEYQADLDRINLFMWAIMIRRQAGK